MKIKKKTIIFGGLATAGLAVGLITPVIVSQTNNTNAQERAYVTDVKRGVANVFENFGKQNSGESAASLFSLNTNGESSVTLPDLDASTISKMQSVANEFIDNYLTNLENQQDVKSALDNFLKDKNIDISQYDTSGADLTSQVVEDSEELESYKSYYSSSNYQTVRSIAADFNKSYKTSLIVAGVAGATAAGFWAASFWTFGATVPWAVAATTQAATYTAQGLIFLGAEQWILSQPSYVLASTLYAIRETYKDLKFYYDLIQNVRKVITAAKVIKTVTYATSWASPVIAIAAFILETLLNNYGQY
ncbi:hypothetical protein [Mycoplasmopsis agassizii]|uniref:Uncharacterized protein n=1 Tax=Mycoplasmopsis agassizii TaxID=33922 RepID=A0ABX4H490_9BACT|nr:hypothetical protein [Mycoplasmopsis agassizii]PAF54707.1 hypothetical protein CJF60_03130 [Mycoplasmopsis agassizii]SMC15969.1 hypothetical protein SAMN02745179_00176 [Mycoplasmopsis agassizii]